jgi:hypothetical protein
MTAGWEETGTTVGSEGTTATGVPAIAERVPEKFDTIRSLRGLDDAAVMVTSPADTETALVPTDRIPAATWTVMFGEPCGVTRQPEVTPLPPIPAVSASMSAWFGKAWSSCDAAPRFGIVKGI